MRGTIVRNAGDGIVTAYDLWRWHEWDQEDASDAPISSVLFEQQEQERLKEECILLRRKT